MNEKKIRELIEKKGKVQAIKVVAAELGLSLKEAKNYVDCLVPDSVQWIDDVSFVADSKGEGGKKRKIDVPLTSHRRGITVLVAIAALLLLGCLTIENLYGKDGVLGTNWDRNVLDVALVLLALSLLLIAGLFLLDSVVSNKRKNTFINLEVPHEFTLHALGSKQNLVVCGTRLEIHSGKKNLICHTQQILEVRFTKNRNLRAYTKVMILDHRNQPLVSMSLRLSDYHLLRKYLMSQGCFVCDTYQRW